MKTVTLEQFKTFEPCWLETEEGRKRLEEIGSRKEEWTAIDVLNLEEVSLVNRLWSVLREEFISNKVLRNFSRVCEERALKHAGLKADNFETRQRFIRYYILVIYGKEPKEDREISLNANAASDMAVYFAANFAEFSLDDMASDLASVMTLERKWQIEELKKMLLEEKEREEHEK